MMSNLNIGNVLLRMGAITDEELAAAVRKQKTEPSKKLGEILVADQVITDEQLRTALAAQTAALSSNPGEKRRGLMAMLDGAVDAFQKSSARVADQSDELIRKLA